MSIERRNGSVVQQSLAMVVGRLISSSFCYYFSTRIATTQVVLAASA